MSTSRILGVTASSMLVMAAFACSTAARSETRFQPLYTFTGGNDGGWPAGDLLADEDGNLYGTTSVGGPNGAGVVFKLAPDFTETVLYHFTGGADGDLPMSGLLMDEKGNLYGVTEVGGKNGAGNVFKLTPGGVLTSIYDFGASSTDGFNPICQLIWGLHHELTGTTVNGGTAHDGTVFSMTLGGKETILHNFSGTDGMYPRTGLTKDADGNLYGTTTNKANGSSGTVYKIDIAGNFKTLATLSTVTGFDPFGTLTLDKAGTIYGTATAGGAHNNGTVFKVTPKGTVTPLYSFSGSTDGSSPEAPIYIDKKGNLLSTTAFGGPSDNGTIFSLTPAGVLTTLYAFTGTSGAHSQAGLIRDKATGQGWLYGTTYVGGTGNGVVFRIRK